MGRPAAKASGLSSSEPPVRLAFCAMQGRPSLVTPSASFRGFRKVRASEASENLLLGRQEVSLVESHLWLPSDSYSLATSPYWEAKMQITP